MIFHATVAAVITITPVFTPGPARAVGSIAPDAAFTNPEQAFDAVFIRSGVGLRGYAENREYAAAIFEMPDGQWHATAVVPGELNTSSIPYHAVPSDAVRVIGAHTHGRPHVDGDAVHVYGEDFSEADRRAAMANFEGTRGRIAAQLLLTSRLEILRMDLSRGYEPASGTIRVSSHVASIGHLDPPAR